MPRHAHVQPVSLKRDHRKLTKRQIELICHYAGIGVPRKHLAELTGLTRAGVYKVLNEYAGGGDGGDVSRSQTEDE